MLNGIRKFGFNYYFWSRKKRIIDIIEAHIPYIKSKRRKIFNERPFTIISNNCWGGVVNSRYFMSEYTTPTVGLYFFPEDYLLFISDLKKYINSKLTIISITDSRYKETLIQKGQKNVIIGKILDIEIIFLHYKSGKEALEKWNRRKRRIVWDNLIFKFNDQNNATFDQLDKFNSMNFEKKLMFVSNRKYAIIFESAILHKDWQENEYVLDDVSSYNKYINLLEFIYDK